MQSANPDLQRNPLEHDILVARRNPSGKKQFIKISAGRKPEAGGPSEQVQYGAPAEQPASGGGYRSIVGFACPDTQDDASKGASVPRGPVLAALPLHPDPTASASCTCYLVNPENLTYVTAWTCEEWNDQQVNPSPLPVSKADTFELLVATPAGKVYLLRKHDNADPYVGVKAIDLAQEAELWSSLRGGTVAGSVRLLGDKGKPRVVPLVNVQSLMPPPRGD